MYLLSNPKKTNIFIKRTIPTFIIANPRQIQIILTSPQTFENGTKTSFLGFSSEIIKSFTSLVHVIPTVIIGNSRQIQLIYIDRSLLIYGTTRTIIFTMFDFIWDINLIVVCSNYFLYSFVLVLFTSFEMRVCVSWLHNMTHVILYIQIITDEAKIWSAGF